MNPYLIGACVLGATDDSQASALAIVKQRPLSAADAQRALAECAKCTPSDLAEQCENIAASIEVRGIDPLPDAAADILAALVERVCSGGDAVVGARTKQTVLGVDITDWDKSAAYSAGAVVRYWGAWYRATRDISSSWWGNDTPDKSDAWVATSSITGDDDLFLDGCDDVLGMFDIVIEQRKMNQLKPVTLAVAKTLLKHGQEVIATAIMNADVAGLPGPTARKNAQAHLQWHADKIAKITGDPIRTVYDSGDDLKKWTMQAFIESNSVDEGAQYLQNAWDQMWQEIGAAIAALPAEARKAAGAIVENVTGIPLWGWSAMIVGLVGIVGYGAYKILAGPAGGAVVKHYLRR